MANRYHSEVDPATPNNAHAYALGLIGCNRDVLELGPAAGHVTRALTDRHCRVTAIECDAEAAAELHGIAERVIVADLNDPDVFADLDAEFDFVLAGDVLEHLLHPCDVLRRVALLLRPGGEVVVSVPNVSHVDGRLSLMQGRWDYGPTGLLDNTHTRFFTLKSIRAMVDDAGLVITTLHRVRVPAFESELALDRATVPTELLDYALADPEAETYQFVFAATADNGDHRLRRVAERNDELERELASARVAQTALTAELEEQRALAAEATAARAALADEASWLRELLYANHEFTKRVSESVTWQALQRIRNRFYGAMGGDRSALARMTQATLRFFGRRLG